MADMLQQAPPLSDAERRAVAVGALETMHAACKSASFRRLTDTTQLSADGRALHIAAEDAGDGVPFLLRLTGPGLAPLRSLLAAASVADALVQASDYGVAPRGAAEEALLEKSEADALKASKDASAAAALALQAPVALTVQAEGGLVASPILAAPRPPSPDVQEVIVSPQVTLASRFTRAPPGATRGQVTARSDLAFGRDSTGTPHDNGASGASRALSDAARGGASMSRDIGRPPGAAELGELLARVAGGDTGMLHDHSMRVALLGFLSQATGSDTGRLHDHSMHVALPAAESVLRGTSSSPTSSPHAHGELGGSLSPSSLSGPQLGGGLAPMMPRPPAALLERSFISASASSSAHPAEVSAEQAMEFVASLVDTGTDVSMYAVWEAVASSNLDCCPGVLVAGGAARLCQALTNIATGFCTQCGNAGSGSLDATTSTWREGRFMPFPCDEALRRFPVKLLPENLHAIGVQGALAVYRAWHGVDTKASTKHAPSPAALAALRSPDTGGAAIFGSPVNPQTLMMRYTPAARAVQVSAFGGTVTLASSALGGATMGSPVPVDPHNLIAMPPALRALSQRALSALAPAPAVGSPSHPAMLFKDATRVGGLNAVGAASFMYPWMFPFFDGVAGPLSEADTRALASITREDPNNLRYGDVEALYTPGGAFKASPLSLRAAGETWSALVGVRDPLSRGAAFCQSALISEVLTADAAASGRTPEDLAALGDRYAPLAVVHAAGTRFLEFAARLMSQAGTSPDAVAAGIQLLIFRGRFAAATGILDTEVPPPHLDCTYSNLFPSAQELVVHIAKDARGSTRVSMVTAGRAAASQVALGHLYSGAYTRASRALLDKVFKDNFPTSSVSLATAVRAAVSAAARQVESLVAPDSPSEEEVPPSARRSVGAVVAAARGAGGAVSEGVAEPVVSALKKRGRSRSRSRAGSNVSDAASIMDSRNNSRPSSPDQPRVRWRPEPIELGAHHRRFIDKLSSFRPLALEAERNIKMGWIPIARAFEENGTPKPAYVMFPHTTAKPPFQGTSFCRICVGPHSTEDCPRNTAALEAIWRPLGRKALDGPRQSKSMVFPE